MGISIQTIEKSAALYTANALFVQGLYAVTDLPGAAPE
jgi:hypothetical protein